VGVGAAAKEAFLRGAGRLEEASCRKIPQARHKREAQQITEAKHLIRIAMGIHDMRPDGQLRVVLQEAIQDVERFALGTGDDLGAKDTVLVGEMRVDTHRPVIIAKVPRIKRRQQRTFADPKALAIGGGALAFAPTPTNGQ
jgi:hypothetical protein